MKIIYELGDRVRIDQHWKRKNLGAQLEERGLSQGLDRYLKSDDMAGASIEFDKYQKQPIDEVGHIVGSREIKVRYGLMYVSDDSYDMPPVDEIRQVSDQYEKIYLVATRMNCIRKVSVENITFLGG